MEFLDTSKFVTSAAVALVTFLLRFIYTFLTKNGERMKIRASSVELIDKVLNEREWKKQENHIIVEEAFEQLYSKPLSFAEIKILLYCEMPNSAFRTYLKYRPAIDLNDKKSKFKFKKGKRPYWHIPTINLKFPKAITKGIFLYTFFGIPASFAMSWLTGDATANLPIGDKSILWFFDCLIWFLAVLFLVEGLIYQSSEKDILRDLGDKFELN